MRLGFIIFISIFSFNIFADSYQDSDCYKKFVKKDKNKIQRDKRDLDMKIFGINLGGVTIFPSDNYYTPSEYNERDIMRAANFDFEYSAFKEESMYPEVLRLVREKTKRKFPEVSYKDIQLELQNAFISGELCGFFGPASVKGAARIVFKRIKKLDKIDTQSSQIDSSERSLVKDISRNSEEEKSSSSKAE